jgi:hypothetical protein
MVRLYLDAAYVHPVLELSATRITTVLMTGFDTDLDGIPNHFDLIRMAMACDAVEAGITGLLVVGFNKSFYSAVNHTVFGGPSIWWEPMAC